MRDLFVFILPGAPQQILTYPFITEPSSPVYAKENTTMEFKWKIKNCTWQVRIVTEEFTLHPNWLPGQVPLKNHTDYNVSKACEEEHITVTLSVTFNVKVLEHVEYFICKVFIENNDETMQMSRVNLTTVAPERQTDSETTVYLESTTTTLDPGNVSLEATTGSGFRLCGHFSALLLCLFITNLALSWMS